jgi:HSP20 family protein
MIVLPTLSRRGTLSPWTRLTRMESVLEPWIREAMSTLEAPETLAWTPTVDLTDTNGEFTLTAELPGVKPKDVEVNVEDDALTIRGEKKEERKEETKNRRLYERSYGSFERSFTLPRSVDPDQVKADFENGVLTVHLPKREGAMGRKIEIRSSK